MFWGGKASGVGGAGLGLAIGRLTWQRPAQAIGPGDVVWIPPGVKHWHGALEDEAMTHVAVAEIQNESSVTWMEQVSDTQ